MTQFRSSGNHTEFSYYGRLLDVETTLLMFQPSFSQSLQSFRLICRFHITDLPSCQNISVIEFNNASPLMVPSDPHPSFPIFNGREIRLRNFSLSSWNGQVLSNVLICELRYCVDLIDFPEMPLLSSFVGWLYSTGKYSVATFIKILVALDFSTIKRNWFHA
jgi:hypothetical protein